MRSRLEEEEVLRTAPSLETRVFVFRSKKRRKRMNKRYLENMIGFIVRLDPPPIHREDNGKELHARDDDWRVTSTESDRMMLEHISGFYRYPLFYDRVIEFQNADLHYLPSIKQGCLILKVQVVVIGDGLVREEALILRERHRFAFFTAQSHL
jgi:hypothetical protein